jgi:hypothetical protein
LGGTSGDASSSNMNWCIKFQWFKFSA